MDRARLRAPTQGELPVLAGTYANASLRAVVQIGSEGGTPTLAFADGRKSKIVRLTPGLFSAGVWRIRSGEAAEGPASRISLRILRTPELMLSRIGNF